MNAQFRVRFFLPRALKLQLPSFRRFAYQICLRTRWHHRLQKAPDWKCVCICYGIMRMLAGDLPAPPVVQLPISSPVAPSPPVDAAPLVAVPEDEARLGAAWELFQKRGIVHDPVVTQWLRGVHLMLCASVTLSGYRRMLGLVEYSTEDMACLTDFLQGLISRGLSAEKGLLCNRPCAACWAPELPYSAI